MFYRLLTIFVIFNLSQYGGSSVALLEVIGSKGVVKVNGKTYGNKSRLILSGGDEVVFGVSGKHAYVSFRYDFLARIYLFILLVSSCSIFFACFCGHLSKITS
jgi:hypothetical protein